ncbi:MAG: glutathione S-transferase family protein [Halioglobus sp.]
MGILVKGKWVNAEEVSSEINLAMTESQKHLRNWITPDGLSFSGVREFAAEPGRYHLYYSRACPFAQRAMIFRHLKGLEDIVSVSEVEPLMLDQGWVFSEAYPDHLYGLNALHEIYTKSGGDLTTRVSVPVLWDKYRQVIVSNESAEIIRMFNSAFNSLTDSRYDFYPLDLREEINALNDWINPRITLGVYRAGFAETQEEYEKASRVVFDALEELDRKLSKARYLSGEVLTEADWRLFTTLLRFDAVYYGLFKLSQKRLKDYPSLIAYTRDLYQIENVAALVDLEHTKVHYYGSFLSVNPGGLIPLSEPYDFSAPHDRTAVAADSQAAA